MTREVVKEFMATVSMWGEQSRAVAVIELTHDGFTKIRANGGNRDIYFFKKAIDSYVDAQIAKENQKKG
jgi:hypothetical protein